MSWKGSIRDQVAAEFRDAQRLRRGTIANEEPAPRPVRIEASVVEIIRARARRIVTRRAS